jgi:predicted DNA-binding transcriptional regulator
VTVKILDAERNLTGKYSAIGYAKNNVALYHGYNTYDAMRKSRAEVIKDALKKIRKEIQKEAEQLNKKLKAEGPIN